MAKRLRVEDDFNPVYPYGYARNQNIPFLTPPFVSSDGFKNFPPGVLSLKLADPITITNGDVSLKVGGGLTLQDGTGKLTVNTEPPLQLTNNKLGIALDAPFDVIGDKLTLLAGHGLSIITKETSTLPGLINTLVVLTGKGIGTESTDNGGSICVRVAEGGGLSFNDDGDLVAFNKKEDKRTLWTTPDPSPNCKILEDKDSKLTLVLTKCGSQILGNVSLLVVKGKFSNINNTTNPNDTDKQITIKLLFDANGVLKQGSTMDSSYWNYRSDNSNLSQPYKQAVGFMPSKTAYPKQTKPANKEISQAKNKIISNVYLGGKIDQPCVIIITFNEEADSEYSIVFYFKWYKTYENVQFDSSSFTFSYIAQE
ncbi:fiber [Human mastadenovirus D]|uniref:Fiber n=1 Tax=Human mastadenovirus D TaxID=130310 RepID=A0A1J0MSD2_9ADEN|nr:fiber [Human mastadenovirus D]